MVPFVLKVAGRMGIKPIPYLLAVATASNTTTAKTVLDTERLTYVEAEIVQAKLPHRPGEIARVASRLGEANININYAYCGFGARNEYAPRLLRRRRSQQGSPNS
jgi:hypothetical protein